MLTTPTHTHTHPQTHHDKVITVSAPPYCVVSTAPDLAQTDRHAQWINIIRVIHTMIHLQSSCTLQYSSVYSTVQFSVQYSTVYSTVQCTVQYSVQYSTVQFSVQYSTGYLHVNVKLRERKLMLYAWVLFSGRDGVTMITGNWPIRLFNKVSSAAANNSLTQCTVRCLSGDNSPSVYICSLIRQKSSTRTHLRSVIHKLCGRLPQYAPAPCKLTFDFWHWKWYPSHVWRGLLVRQF